ncbi:UDP-N-acetylmuramoyl-L-alanyl-D-glutamate--2,6-diaminopimelate ligase [Psychrobacter sp. Ps7]|jgi:UDP-N-acetylmuramoyl-L-alanyl-D-glutamate--2,6-diaminopimelate ligase|uniref:UDP-N-acetylmuramoyl-L-alanyl-D-glutamate--2, 6-diaminopimelate ligase n=1 Tax=Psychrobacter sp. Ps7 TaxID=2790961 RepID=UPI001EE0ED37|nr:UDP-N-acetylmuramoyl-L-alanyl-D-glutamate--2,6-diaminopimelate ligase [Psychrobacter sp. Ps7]MCG3873626.1 UDP-N-acetylmuramoyl-L-alanyl-D-glutamate--2,6-diaminopimelate ligase [Psychrobacter sp. Ps7]
MTLSPSSPSITPVTLQQLTESSISNSRHGVGTEQALQKLSTQTTLVGADSKPMNSFLDIPFLQFRLDSRQLEPNDVFVLLKSHIPNCQKSRDYLYQAAEHAAFILSEIDPTALLNTISISNHADITLPNDSATKVQQQLAALPCPVLYVPNIRDFLGTLIQARLQYQQPVTLPTVIAVTGTNGKTTISQLVAQLTQLTGMSSAVMGTAGNGRLGALVQASHTTGDALAVQQFLYQMGTENAELLALEASSHGLDQQRLQGMPVSVAIYTNLSRDHLDYHADMAEYAAAKARLFDKAHFPDLTHAIINIDDDSAQIMLDTAHASDLTVWTYSLESSKSATFVAAEIKPSLQGVEISLRTDLGDGEVNHLGIVSPLLGRFNVANLLAAMAAAVALGISLERVTAVVPQLQGAVGRMQRVPSNDGCFIVDYAHTPDALSQVLASLKTHCKGQLWAVFGCGGDRDAGKRPLMTQAGLAGADKVVLTADNPRTEDPNAILQDMQAGMTSEQYQRTYIEPARQTAIEYAVNKAAPDDMVVIAGKGHETYQEINHVRYDFDDSVILQNALKQAGRL